MPNQDAHQPLRGASEIPDWRCPNPLGTLGLIRPDSDRLTANQSFRCAPGPITAQPWREIADRVDYSGTQRPLTARTVKVSGFHVAP